MVLVLVLEVLWFSDWFWDYGQRTKRNQQVDCGFLPPNSSFIIARLVGQLMRSMSSSSDWFLHAALWAILVVHSTALSPGIGRNTFNWQLRKCKDTMIKIQQLTAQKFSIFQQQPPTGGGLVTEWDGSSISKMESTCKRETSKLVNTKTANLLI